MKKREDCVCEREKKEEKISRANCTNFHSHWCKKTVMAPKTFQNEVVFAKRKKGKIEWKNEKEKRERER